MRKDIYDTNYDRLIKLIPDLRDMKPGEYRKSITEGFMDLHLDILEKEKDFMRISLAHNYIQNGDNMADPDMEIKVYLIENWNKAEALTYQQDSMGVYQTVYPSPGRVNIRAKKEQNSFLRKWLINIKNQGHSLKEIA